MAEVLAFVGGLVALGGLVLLLLAGVGGLRLPDFFTRLHAAGLGAWGASIAFLGLAVMARVPAQALLLAGLAVLGPVLQAAWRHALADAVRASDRPAGRMAEDEE